MDTPLSETPMPSEESAILTFGSFVGRQREIGELKAALDDALSGHVWLVMLGGTRSKIVIMSSHPGRHESTKVDPYRAWARSPKPVDDLSEGMPAARK